MNGPLKADESLIIHGIARLLGALVQRFSGGPLALNLLSLPKVSGQNEVEYFRRMMHIIIILH